MSTKLHIMPLATIAPLGAGVLRRLQVEFRPICDGRKLLSPDERYLARAMSTYGPHLFGGSKSCYEFVVETRAGARLQHIEIPVPRDELINWRLEGCIDWADDSSSVTFKFQRIRVTILTDLERFQKKGSNARTADQNAEEDSSDEGRF